MNQKIEMSFKNDKYEFGQIYNKIYQYKFENSNLYGKVMVFNGITKTKKWKEIIYFIETISKKYQLNFKFNEYVICVYTTANQFEIIKNLFNDLKELNKNQVLYFKLDFQTISNKQYNNKNYIYSSIQLENINQSYLNNIIDFFNLKKILIPLKS